MPFNSDDELLHPFEARLSAQSGETLRVPRDLDEANPWLETELMPTHKRVPGDLIGDNGRVVRRSEVVTYHPRDRSLLPL
jgi:hypothetical protein